MCEDWFGQEQPHCVECLTLRFVDGHGGCGSNGKLSSTLCEGEDIVRGCECDARDQHVFAAVSACADLCIDYVRL